MNIKGRKIINKNELEVKILFQGSFTPMLAKISFLKIFSFLLLILSSEGFDKKKS